MDILLISETKLDKSFPIGQFQIGFSIPYRRDRDKKGGGILLYVREDILSNLVSFKNDDTNIEHFFTEINLRKEKWLLSSSCNSHSNLIETHSNYLKKGFDHGSGKFDNCIVIGDFYYFIMIF